MNAQTGAYAPTGSACLKKAEIGFLEAIQGLYGALDFVPIADGQIRRFHIAGDRAGSLNGWYVLHMDEIAHGCFGSWKAGSAHTWSDHHRLSGRDVEALKERMRVARVRRGREQHQRQQQAAAYANRVWRKAVTANPRHPYLEAKQCLPHNLRQSGDWLLVPLSLNGRLVNLQKIHADGSKRFLKGGMIKGAYSALGAHRSGQPIYVCEGWATGATLHEETGHSVACAMNAGNLQSVAERLRQRYPQAKLIIAGDDDRQTPGNPGRMAATNAALAAGALVTFPNWPSDSPLSLTDFNDLRCWSACHDF